MRFSELSDDAIDHILTSLPDFRTYNAAIRASKHVHDVWNRHPKSTLRAIARNVAGPALPSALRLVRFVRATAEDGQDAKSALKTEAELVHSDIEPGDECLMLQRHAQVVRRLEERFSRRCKDRTSAVSRLSAIESHRFHRAVYRYWLYVVYMRKVVDEREDDDDDDGNTVHVPEEDRLLEFVPFLDAFSTDELFEIKRVYAFLSEVVYWTISAGLVNRWPPVAGGVLGEHVLLYSGPQTIQEGLEGRLISGDYIPHADAFGAPRVFFQRPFEHLLAARRVSRVTRDQKRKQAVVDSVVGEQDPCDACGTPAGTNLWGASNWDLLKGSFAPSEMCSYLEANLPRNAVETAPVVSAMTAPAGGFDYKAMMDEMLELGPDESGTWSRDKWYCLHCVRHLFQQRFRHWLSLWKARTTEGVQEDCWYGYNCRTQVWKRSHAEKLNVSRAVCSGCGRPGRRLTAASCSFSTSASRSAVTALRLRH
ncbi:hypothetical protein CERSUDRAFT_110193 [Gelatoporia subvermispora B]|uniref:F-box domain-containing protein n=1 Tax=Ceriporiopsis subvermispora (strain B) TaxID=914234 RepID=M2RT51_CERS8|nr:hypothetical protein CERSUDRAFT_110193 [Gelatoporia subvermispora B]